MKSLSLNSSSLRFGALLTAAGLVGCSSTTPLPLLDPPTTRFKGLSEIVAQEPSRKVDLFLVHGMCHHDEAWADSWLERMANLAGSTYHSTKRPDTFPLAEVKVYSATIPFPNSGPGAEVRFHAIVWSGLTKPLKDRLCYDQTKKSKSCESVAPVANPPYPHPRAKLNSAIKDDLLNDCFSDAISYLGAARPAIIAQIQEALLEARTDSVPSAEVQQLGLASASKQNDRGLVVVSSSLGSKMVFDSILELTKNLSEDSREAGIKLRNSTRAVFMAANQIPLLSLADLGVSGKPVSTINFQRSALGAYAPDPLEALFGSTGPAPFGGFIGPQFKPAVVAFTDPNDLLSYISRPYVGAAEGERTYDMIDVVMSNASTFLGLVENPYKAHTAYLDNKKVVDLMFCGYPRWANCK